ncbi:hypothetical protein SeLEV6574_g04001 [Synchytrium endobioticum]|uniref:BRO1 domain-containing protein n=1 Tax=Synchytrium endobioticum TaxID=286115 RepID=A0A507D1L5_9FUNG|nr:hypothetical protein SeLEV6574_g04001 [Synchytrium endobioticum]
MSKHFIVTLLLFQLFHHVFTDYTDAMMAHTEALRGERLKLEQAFTWEKNDDQGIFENLEIPPPEPSCDDRDGVTELVDRVIERKMKRLYPFFPGVVVMPPTADMSLAELEFCWEALKLTLVMLQRADVSENTRVRPRGHSVYAFKEQYMQEMRRRLHDAIFGPSPAIEYLPGQKVDWISINTLIISEILRGAKALHVLEHTDYSPVSSFTECEVLLNGVEMHESARNLYWDCGKSRHRDDLFYCMFYTQMVAQRLEFITTACSKFLHERRKFSSAPSSGLTCGLARLFDQMRSPKDGFKKNASRYKERLSKYHLPEDFHRHIQRVTSEIDKLKGEMAKKYYQLEVAVAEISEIVAATPHPLGFVPQDVDLPFETTLLFELLPPQDVYPTEISPALALAAEYHLLLLWRCMQQLSLLVWFRSRYVIELLQENPSFTSEQVNGAATEIADMAEYILQAFDAYEKAVGQSDNPRLSDKEKELCDALIVQARNHLVGTWYDVLQVNVNEYIMIVDKAMADVKNLDYSAGVDSLASIQLVDKIPLKVHQLISAYPVPENLPPRYLELATKLHSLMVHRLGRTESQSSEIDELSPLLGDRNLLYNAYNLVSKVFPDFHTFSLSSNTVLGAQRDILDPATSTYSGPYESIEYGLGTGTRADFEASSSSGRSQNRRNRHAGGRSDVGPSGGFEHLE